MAFDDTLIRRLPKTDLHVHLDGSLRIETLIELARERGVELPSKSPEGLRELVFKKQYTDLPDYLRGFAYTCAVMTDAEALERIAYELAQDNLAEGVRYVEVRFAPQLHVRKGLDIGQVISAVDRGMARAKREHAQSDSVKLRGEPPFNYGLITSAMRMFRPGFAPYYESLFKVLDQWPDSDVRGVASLSLARSVVEARDRLGLPIVGFDLAGAEAGNPAVDHVEAFDFAHRHFLKKTVHAGEAYGPESIFQAITRLHADRIGHGTHIYSTHLADQEDPERYVSQLAQYTADRRITLEVCITSNLQTMPQLARVEDHPFGRMVKDKLSVTLCTDNRLMSRTSVTEEIVKVRDAFELTPRQLRSVVIYGFKRSFYPGTYLDKRAYVREAIDFYDRVVEEDAPEASVESRSPDGRAAERPIPA